MVPKLKPFRANLQQLKVKPKPGAARRTGGTWERWAKAFRRRHPLCQRCQADLSDHVHHVVPVKDAPDRVFDPTNVVALCKLCHRLVHAGEALNAKPMTDADRGLIA